MLTFLAFIAVAVFLSHLSTRIKDLEQQVAEYQKRATPQSPQPTQASQQVAPQAPVVAQTAIPKPADSESVFGIFAEPTQPASNAPALQPAVAAAATNTAHDDSLEFKFGSQIFTAVGALAVIIGIGFFLRYAFQSGLITEGARIILGIISGLGLMAGGYYLSKKYANYGQTLIGTGVGLLYLSIYSSYNYYHFISQPSAFVLMLIVTALGVAMAMVTDSIVLAGFAALGGFITPYLLGGTVGDLFPLFTYIFVLDIGIVAIAFSKLWRPLMYGSFAGTILVVLTWMGSSYNTSLWLPTEIFLGLFFVLYLCVSFIHYSRNIAPEDEYDLGLVILNPLLFFAASYNIINQVHHGSMGIFTILLGLVYIVLWQIVRKGDERDIRFRRFLGGVGFVLLSIAVPIQFEKFTITIVWALEALVLTYTAVKIKSRPLKVGAQIIFTFVFLRLILLDSQIAVVTPFINMRFITAMISLIALSASYWLMYKNPSEDGDDTEILGFMMAEIALVFLVGFSVDIYKFFDASFLSLFWIVAVGIIAAVGFAVNNFIGRLISFVLLFVVILRVIFTNGELSRTAVAFANVRFGLLVAILAVSALFLWLYRSAASGRMTLKTTSNEHNNAQNLLLVEMYLIAQLLFTLEISDFFASFWLPVVWTLIALIAFFISFAIKSKTLRYLVYGTYILSVLRVFFVESSINPRDYLPVMNGRVLSFVVVALSLFVTAYILSMRSSEVDEDEKGNLIATLSVTANILLIALISFEVLDFFNNQIMTTSTAQDIATLENTKRVVLSLAWILYAMALFAVGIYQKSRWARIMAISVVSITVFKVFLYDTAELDNFYRFVSYISLGIILLLTGFLYNKYKSRILQFITAENSPQGNIPQA